MEAVEKDLQWDLVFPDTSDPDYDKLWGRQPQALARRVQKAGQGLSDGTRSRHVEYDHRIGVDVGRAGVVFLERMNEDSNSWYFEDLISTNPCITGETLVYTENGLSADELWFSGKPVSVAVDARMDERLRAGIRGIRYRNQTGVSPHHEGRV